MNAVRAFTLIELMAAIALMLLLAAGIPALFRREGNAGLALRGAQRELVTALELARHTAQARQAAVRLRIPAATEPGEAEGRWWLERAEGSQWLELRTAGEWPPGTRVAVEEGAAEFVEFGPEGNVRGGERRLRVMLAPGNAGPGTPVRAVGILENGRIEEGGP
jgi:prepilin-type N-terminal cleavage/methylation domain-containing protein